MKFNEVGVTDRSIHHFYSPSPLARRLYFYPTGIGHFYVEPPYMVHRLDFNSFLLICVCTGQLFVDTGTGPHTVRAGSAALIDCHYPHRYYATEPGEFYFFHFDGGTSGEFFKEIVERHGDIIALRDSSAMRAAFDEMLEMFRRDARPSEGELSLKIHAILCMLMQNDAGLARGGESGGPIERVVTYIHTHLAEPLTVDMLAGVAGFSPCYFSRRFRLETGMTPYHYILTSRIDRSKQLLNTTDMTVQRIALEVGFASGENFINAFIKLVGVSPARFRKMPL